MLYCKAQRHSKDEIFQRYPFEDTVDGHGAFGDLANGVTVTLQDASSSSPLSPNVETAVRRTPMTAMLRPLLRESDFAHWQKAAGSNAKWVSLLNEEQLSDFNLLREGSESGTADTSSDASAFQPDQQQLLLGVAVIKNAIVVNSAAYLKVLNPIASPHVLTLRSARMTGVGDSSEHVCVCVWVGCLPANSSRRIDIVHV